MRNIDMRAVTTADDPTVNILAFFKVVASSQISPHSETSRQTVAFRAAKIVKNSYMQILESANVWMCPLYFIFSGVA